MGCCFAGVGGIGSDDRSAGGGTMPVGAFETYIQFNAVSQNIVLVVVVVVIKLSY